MTSCEQDKSTAACTKQPLLVSNAAKNAKSYAALEKANQSNLSVSEPTTTPTIRSHGTPIPPRKDKRQ